jgi:transposase-like protein
MGFWKALAKAFAATRQRRCRVHKTANALNKLPRKQQPDARRNSRTVWMAAARENAGKSPELFVQTYQAN